VSWPPWKRFAERGPGFFEEHPMWLPVTFQLATGPRRLEADDELELVFCGAAENEHDVFEPIHAGRSPLSPKIEAALADGEVVWYRAQARPTLAEAEAFRDELLGEGGWAWNAAGC